MQIEGINTENTLRGIVKWFNDVKGFGFIRHESGKDVFVHYSVIEGEGFKTLKEGEEITYELDIRDRGYFAKNVKKLIKETEIITVNTKLPQVPDSLLQNR